MGFVVLVIIGSIFGIFKCFSLSMFMSLLIIMLGILGSVLFVASLCVIFDF